ncbi:hypothetical protein FNV43_RR06279 [Rhamnella rubrinervis]|uniref:Major facilitator superfamily (MFS) profile domain-containing protein n=1 Tax=Rhamnella rubrinervis TaxID=2594499 RepID=A0A8K0ML92_9ROSA|nr:hypothetical protein FNV43_RR06279 [Rhamnella rubrinervis]
MEDFLSKCFPSIERKKERESGHDDNAYCKFDNYPLKLFTSSLYLAALVASFFASTVTRVFGRKPTMFFGGLVFLISSILHGVAQNLALLIVGRLLLGVGVGFANLSIPVYLSEMAPAKNRGALDMGFQMAITIGILVANLQFTGINIIMFYAPVLFKSLGFEDNSSLMSAVITGVVNFVATLVSIFTVDRFGRRILFLEGGVQMFICQITIGVMIGAKFGSSGQRSLSDFDADYLLFFICAYVAAYAWS